jgi:hypothetical protein
MRYLTNTIRFAVVTSVNYTDGFLSTRWVDQGDNGPTIPFPHLTSSGGSGIFLGIKSGTTLALMMSSYEQYICVGVLPQRTYYSDLSAISESQFDDVQFPNLSAGEVVLQGPSGSQLRFNKDESISFDNRYGEGFIIGGGSNSQRCSIFTPTPTEYKISQSGIKAQGIIRRDVKTENEQSFTDYLKDINSEQTLEEIGWNPNKSISYVSESTNNRNPPFVENREIICEFAKDWSVGTQISELINFQDKKYEIVGKDNRRERRGNVLSLSLSSPNELIEKISGTVVDIFGNILDINRNIISVTTKENTEDYLQHLFEQSRHTIAYHFEMNSRKGYEYRSEFPNENNSSGNSKPLLLTEYPQVWKYSNNNKDRAKFSIDIDKEGLTKINIPSSSETGNIPTLTRSEISSVLKVEENGDLNKKDFRKGDEALELYRNDKKQDIFLEQVGPGGIKIKGTLAQNRLEGFKSSWIENNDGVDKTQKVFSSEIEAGTAYHDITSTAILLLKRDFNRISTEIFNDPSILESPLAVSNEIDNRLPDGDILPNSGGRSVCLNLDGSLETSIGANSVDRTSAILDLAGSLVMRVGRDKSGKSIIAQTDGDVAIEIGGFDFIGESENDNVDERFVGNGKSREISLPLDKKQYRSGKLVLKIKRANSTKTGPDVDDHLIIVDEYGITLKSAGRLYIDAKQDLVLHSGSRVVIDAAKVQIYDGNMAKLIKRDGRKVI